MTHIFVSLCVLLFAAVVVGCASPARDSTPQIQYHAGVKYVLHTAYTHDLGFPCQPFHDEFLDLTAEGVLTIHAGYAWDGASGPALDTVSILRASLVHDVCYELIRRGILPHERKHQADLLFQMIYREDVANSHAWWRRAIGRIWNVVLFWAVDRFGESSVQPKAERPVLTAP